MHVVFDLIVGLAGELLDDFTDRLEWKDIKRMPVLCLLLVVLAVVLHAL